MSGNRYISPVFSSVLKATLRDSSSFLLEMLCSEFVCWSSGSECGITQSGLNFLSLCGCWGLWRPAKTLLFVCVWRGLICCSIYLFILSCKLGSGFAFFPIPVGCAMLPTQNHFHNKPNSMLFSIKWLGSLHYQETQCLATDCVWLNSLFDMCFGFCLFISVFCPISLSWCSLVHSIAMQILGSAHRKHNFSDVASCAGRPCAF